MRTVDVLDWDTLVSQWELKYWIAIDTDEFECQELWGEEEASKVCYFRESEAEEMEMRLSAYESGDLEKAIEGLDEYDLEDYVPYVFCFILRAERHPFHP